MAHPQNSPRGLFAMNRIDIDDAQLTDDASGNLLASAGLALSGQSDAITQTASTLKVPVGLSLSGRTEVITQDASGVNLPGAISLSGQSGLITQSSTGVVLPTVTTIPSARAGNGTLSVISDSTGQCVVINQTGTTWVYLNITSVRPTIG